MLVSLWARVCVYLKVTEDGDVGKFFAISMRIESQYERPLQTHEAPHTRQVQTGRICEGCRHTHIKSESLMSWRPLSLQNMTDMNKHLHLNVINTISRQGFMTFMHFYSHSLWEMATLRKEMNATMDTMEKMTPMIRKNFSPFNHVLQ